MRNRFSHLLPLRETELEGLWTTATLTVDANVLLDLYRYHAETRDGLFRAFEQFSGRCWISHQAAEEFFRNRLSVIAAADKDFDDADQQLRQLLSTIEKLKQYRLVSREVVDELAQGLRREVESARGKLKTAKETHPNYLDDDPVLERILAAFDGAVGPEPSENERAELAAEAKRRQEARVPPGFLDGKKSDERSFGDYFLWAQVLSYAATEGRPIILVTSERKDDWWEKHRGRRSPRRELLDEAAKITKQRVLICETGHFLNIAERREGRSLAPGVAAEIKALGVARSKTSDSSQSDAEEQVYSALESFGHVLVDSDEQITSLIAQTNASGYYADDIEVLDAGPVDLSDVTIPFRARMRFSGEPDEDRIYCGDVIYADITGTLAHDGSEWEVIDYDIIAKLEEPDMDELDE